MRLAALLLAAGRSTRMGVHKALAPWHGTTLLEYQLSQLAAVDAIDDIVVVTGWSAAAVEPIVERAGARAVRNERFDDGKSSSIRCGVAAIGEQADALLLLAVDQPRPAGVLRRLAAAHREHRPPITAPSHHGRRGHPLILDRALFPELLAMDEASRGLRAVVERHAAEVREVAFDDPIVCADINTQEDLERWSQAVTLD